MAHVGVIALVENAGELPGVEAAIMRAAAASPPGCGRGRGSSGRWLEAEPVTEGRPSVRIEALGRELRVVLEEIA